MGGKNNPRNLVAKSSKGFYNSRRRERRLKSEGPQFEVTGTHVVILVGALFAFAWFAGLLPDP